MDGYFDLGKHERNITTTSPEAKLWFNRGLNWCYGFNHEEGLNCFQKALEYDPDCAMAYWGIAYAAGPFYNMPWCDFSLEEAVTCTAYCYEHIRKALSLRGGASELEASLIRALAARVQAGHPVLQEEYNRWDDAYAEAMRSVYRRFPKDSDVAAIFAEALMTRTPWKLWNVRTNEPAEGADTLEALEVLEGAIAQADAAGERQHPAILHLHIHALEMSPTPERALISADRLGTLCPEAGHMCHMPGHIYVLCGLYEKAKLGSAQAIEADRKYLAYAGPYNFYTTSRCHDLHLMMYTCMFLGQFEPAMAAAEEMCGNLTRDVLDVPGKPYLVMTMEGYYSMMMHVLVRFGKWRRITETPLPECPMLYCVSTSMHHYARGVAYAALGEFSEAEAEKEKFDASLGKILPGRKFFNNKALDVLAIAKEMLEGELAYHKGDYEIAFEHLREAVRLDDNLAYSEPWAWMHPPRHALGALLVEQGQTEEAERVYREDLGLSDSLQRCAQHPDNVWALHGLAACLRRRGADEDLALLEPKLNAALAKSDVLIESSCCCAGRLAVR